MLKGFGLRSFEPTKGAIHPFHVEIIHEVIIPESRKVGTFLFTGETIIITTIIMMIIMIIIIMMTGISHYYYYYYYVFSLSCSY